jgi:hypothetical protein
MSFVAAATAIGFTGVGATIAAGAMMGGATTVAGNVIGGRDPFDNIGRGVVLGGITGGIAPSVASTFDLSMPMAAGITQGGLTALATGDIGQGLMAGMGAYGAYGLAEGLGGGVSGSNVGAEQAFGDVQAVEGSVGDKFNKYLTGPDAGAKPFTDSRIGTGNFFKDNFKYMAAATAPILAGESVQAKGPQTITKPGMIRPYSFDPYGGTYTAGTPYEAQVKQAAGGGLMGLAAGGMASYGDGDDVPRRIDSGGMFDFTQRSEPVVRMARGGIARYDGSEGSLVGGDAPGGGGSDYFANQFAPDVFAPIATPTATDNALAAYQAGNYGEASRLLGEAGMSAQDVVSKYGLSQADAATVAQNLGYTGNLSGLQYATPVVTAPVVTDTSGGLAALNTAATNTDTSGGLAALNTAATNTTATNTDTSGGLAALNTAATTPYYFQVNPDVAAEYARNPMGLTPEQFAQAHYTNFGKKEGREFEPSAAVKYATANKTDLVANTLKWIDTNPFATPDQINAAIKGSGMSTGDVNRALDSLVSSGKITQAERFYIQQGKGLSAMADSTAEWLKKNPNATQTQIDAVLKAANMDTTDAQRVLAHGFQVADKDLAAAAKYIQDNPDVARWITSDQGKAYVKAHPEFDAKDIAFTHYERYGKKEGRKWGEDATQRTTTTVTTPTNIATAASTALPVGVSGAGVTTINPNGTVTTRPNIPGIPDGGFTGMANLRDVYTAGGGSLGYIPYAPKTIDEFNTKYGSKLTGGSKQSYDYLTGKTPYDPTPYTKTGEIMKPYFESVGRFPAQDKNKNKKYIYDGTKYVLNPDYVKPSYVLAGEKAASDKAAAETTKAGVDTGKTINVLDKEGQTEVATLRSDGKYYTSGGNTYDEYGKRIAADGGLMAMARGGMAQQFNLGDYSDGGRLLRGPGDGVSDSIPASIGGKRPARLADGEFVVPARIVSELGNGSTEAGARKLYAMMDRIQKARRGTVGKGRVAKNSRSEKYLPA